MRRLIRTAGQPIAFFALLAVGVGVIIVLIAFIGRLLSVPSPDELTHITSSHPNEKVIAYRFANAALPNAEPSEFLSDLPDDTMNAAMWAIVSTTKAISGGLWVGGRVFLTSHRLIFTPNMVNKWVHRAPLSDVALSLSEVSRVDVTWGFVTNIVDVQTIKGEHLKFRCSSASQFAKQIKATARDMAFEPKPSAVNAQS